MDPELLPGSGFGIKVPDPAKSERAIHSWASLLLKVTSVKR